MVSLSKFKAPLLPTSEEDTYVANNQDDTQIQDPKTKKVYQDFQKGQELAKFSFAVSDDTGKSIIPILSEEEEELAIEETEETGPSEEERVGSLKDGLSMIQALVGDEATFLEKASASIQVATDPKSPQSLQNALSPKRVAAGGANGTYFIHSLKKSEDSSAEIETLGVFKPCDESVGAPNCPKLDEKLRSKKGIEPEEQSMLECVAYLLGKNIVPPTAMLTLSSPDFHSNDLNVKKEDIKTKTGSLQKFCPNAQPVQKLVPAARNNLIKQLPLKEFQDLAILDIRAHNSDRHLGNLMTDGKKIIPIDHGCICPKAFQDRAELCWMLWPQAFTPFTEAATQEILKIDSRAELAAIRKAFPNFPDQSADTLEFSNLLLQKGAKNGFSPFHIGCFITGSRYREAPMKVLYEKTSSVATRRAEMSKRLDDLIDHLKNEHDTLWKATFKEAVEKTARKIPVDTTDIFAEKIGKSLSDFINTHY